MKYTELNGLGVSRSGRLFVPERHASKLAKQPNGALLYKGTRISTTTGREYYDVELYNLAEATRLLQSANLPGRQKWRVCVCVCVCVCVVV